MLRLLIWLVVAGCLLGFFYKVATRGGMEREAARVRETRLAAPEPSSSAVAPATLVVTSERSGAIGFGLSFALAKEPAPEAKVAQLACHGDPAPTDKPHKGSCNPYVGDSSCRIVMPIACFRASGAAKPPNVQADFDSGWTHGQLGATQPVMGALLKSEPSASARCEAELGPGWRMAEFHDGEGGWGLQGERGPSLRADTRYWVHINDQKGNCWNSAS